MSDTDKCPKCGGEVVFCGTARPKGTGQVARCHECGFAASACGMKELSEDNFRLAALHRIRELEATVAERERACFVEALQAAQARDRVRELETENERLRKAVEKAQQLGDAIHETAPFHTRYRSADGTTSCAGKMIADVAREALKK